MLDNLPLVVNCGLGVDSTAVLVGLHRRNIRPDLIIFADTGGEKPDTYKYRDILNKWLKTIDFPRIKTVKRSPYIKRNFGGQLCRTLEEECLIAGALPSIAYGFKKCSLAWKKCPVEKYLEFWRRKNNYNEQIVQVISYEAGEERRVKVSEKPDTYYWYPLIEWGWYRLDCIKAIVDAGLPVPPKSACFFCPSSQKREIVALSENHPDLIERAIALERNAASNLQTVKGLGRRFSWEKFLLNREATIPGFEESFVADCYCDDGGGTDKLYWKEEDG